MEQLSDWPPRSHSQLVKTKKWERVLVLQQFSELSINRPTAILHDTLPNLNSISTAPQTPMSPTTSAI